MRDLVGQRVGQYNITELIAKGGMASVYRAEQTSMSRDVAIKVLPTSLTHDDTFIERFYREVEIIASLQHPHILPVYDFGEFEEMPYIVMAYLPGGTLEDKMQQGLVHGQALLRTLNQIAEALDFAHSKNIIHRDLKPANFLLDERGNTYLADFGLARITEASSNLTGTYIVGTPAYMAPEQAKSGEVTPATDLYALGAVVYQMLVGQPPFTASSPTALMMAHLMEPIPKILTLQPDLPPTLQLVFERALAKEPTDRYTGATEFVEVLTSALGGAAQPTGGTFEEPQVMTALLMTNMVGHVIFIDHQCLQVLKRHQSEARTIIGKPLHQVLGFERSLGDALLKAIDGAEEVIDEPFTITDAKGETQSVLLSAAATRDDDGKFVGSDIQLRLVREKSADLGSASYDTLQQPHDTREENYLQVYFKAQIEGLASLMKQWGGRKLVANLEDIINETGQRNVWPISMQDGYITVQLKREDTDIYRAILARAISYTASMIGEKLVVRELQQIDKKMDPMVLQSAQHLGLDQLYREILA